MTYSFTVPSIPEPSAHRQNGKRRYQTAAAWMELVRGFAIAACGRPMLNGAVGVEFRFFFRGEGEHLKKPDVTNLVKSAEDALTGIMWRDDCQVNVQWNEKDFADESRMEVAVWSVSEYGRGVFLNGKDAMNLFMVLDEAGLDADGLVKHNLEWAKGLIREKLGWQPTDSNT